jgi:hypothetical protein
LKILEKHLFRYQRHVVISLLITTVFCNLFARNVRLITQSKRKKAASLGPMCSSIRVGGARNSFAQQSYVIGAYAPFDGCNRKLRSGFETFAPRESKASSGMGRGRRVYFLKKHPSAFGCPTRSTKSDFHQAHRNDTLGFKTEYRRVHP